MVDSMTWSIECQEILYNFAEIQNQKLLSPSGKDRAGDLNLLALHRLLLDFLQ